MIKLQTHVLTHRPIAELLVSVTRNLSKELCTTLKQITLATMLTTVLLVAADLAMVNVATGTPINGPGTIH